MIEGTMFDASQVTAWELPTVKISVKASAVLTASNEIPDLRRSLGRSLQVISDFPNNPCGVLDGDQVTWANGHSMAKSDLPLPFGTDMSYTPFSVADHANDTLWFTKPPQSDDKFPPSSAETRYYQIKGGAIVKGIRWTIENSDETSDIFCAFPIAAPVDCQEKLTEGVTYGCIDIIMQEWTEEEYKSFQVAVEAAELFEKNRVKANVEVAVPATSAEAAPATSTSWDGTAIAPATTWGAGETSIGGW